MASVLENWSEVLRTQNLSPDKRMDLGSRWLLIVRASVTVPGPSITVEIAER